MRKIVRRTFVPLFFVCAVVILLLATMKASSDARYFSGYDKSAPVNAQIRSDRPDGDVRWISFQFDGIPGIPVPTVMAMPATEGPFPCIIFLHGIGQRKEFLEEIARPFVDAGFAICCFDQYTRGERRIPSDSPIEGALALRRRAAMTVVETRRLIDYLETRADIAAGRIYLNGASFGAITGSNAAAFDPRIRATVLTYGGGHLPTLLASDAAREELGIFTAPATWIASYFFAPADPIQYVDQIAPRPLLVQAGKHDRIVPVESGEKLYRAAHDPKELVLYDSDHIGLDESHVWRVLNDTIAWLKEQDEAVRHATAPQAAPSVG